MNTSKTITNRHAKLIKRLGDTSDYPQLLKNVKNALCSGAAKAFINDDVGIVITKPVFNGKKMGMLVWVAIGFCQNAITRYLPFFELIAADSGCKFIEFRTRRKGFKRLAPQFNFTETRPCDGFFVFTKEV